MQANEEMKAEEMDDAAAELKQGGAVDDEAEADPALAAEEEYFGDITDRIVDSGLAIEGVSELSSPFCMKRQH